ncbi:MAG: hypothetical protein NC133_02630 [Prevotella sp.]|nr:hypothetical protein [Prevotella sp.]
MTDSEFEKLLNSQKHFSTEFKFPKINSKGFNELLDKDKNKYVFDYQFGSAGAIVVALLSAEAKQKWQLRYGTPLIRIDINGAPHMLESGEQLVNHIHIFYPEGTKVYKIEEYNNKMYQSLNPWDVLLDFFKQCNIEFKFPCMQEEI